MEVLLRQRKNDAVHPGKTSGRTASNAPVQGSMRNRFIKGKPGMHRMVPVLAGRKAYIACDHLGMGGAEFDTGTEPAALEGNFKYAL